MKKNDEKGGSVQPLTNICAAVVGAAMGEEVTNRLTDEEDTKVSEEVEMKALEELYESMPARYRRCVFCPFTIF